MPDKPRAEVRWQLLLGLLGASAGITFVLYLVGAIVVTRRFGTLMLPGAESITPLSREPLIAVGARALLAPLLAAAASSALFGLLVAIRLAQPRRERGLVVAVLFVVAAVAAGTVAAGYGVWENAAFVGLVEVVAALAWLRFRRTRDGPGLRPAFRIGAVMALGVAGVAAAVVFVHIWRPPVDLEYAEIELRDGGGTASGIYLALTDNELYVAPAGRCEGGFVTHRRVLVLPRSDVKRITLHRKTHVWDGGPQQPGAPADAGCPEG
jgi:hypothetical protein